MSKSDIRMTSMIHQPHMTNCNDNCPREDAQPRRSLWRRIISLPAMLVIGAVKLYQWLLSPILGGQCRFYPSCSNYFIQAVQKYGVIRGGFRGTLRILKCHPFHRGGYDPP